MAYVKIRNAYGVEFTTTELVKASGRTRAAIHSLIHDEHGMMEDVCYKLGFENAEQLERALEHVRAAEAEEEAAKEAAVDKICAIVYGDDVAKDEAPKAEEKRENTEEKCENAVQKCENTNQKGITVGSLRAEVDEMRRAFAEEIEHMSGEGNDAEAVTVGVSAAPVGMGLPELSVFDAYEDALYAVKKLACALGLADGEESALAVQYRNLTGVIEAAMVDRFSEYIVIDWSETRERMRG